MSNEFNAGNLISWLFGLAVFVAGIINTFWGNDPQFGVMLVLLSFIYPLPVNGLLEKWASFSIPKFGIVKILFGIFIVIAVLGVGELFAKIELMKTDFQ